MNKMIQTLRSLFLGAGLMLPTFSLISFAPPAGMPAGGMPGFPQMSPQEMQEIEAEMARLGQMMEGMSPEEQGAFLDSMVQEAMEEVKKDLSEEGKELIDKLEGGDLSEEDFNKLMQELAPTEPKKDESKPVAEKPKPKPAEPKPIVTSKHQQAIDLINSLIKHTNLFIQKAATIPDLPSKIEMWSKKRVISWQPNMSWNSFRAQLDILVSYLERLKEQDKKTKAYKHLDELLKNETLYNHLSKIEKDAVSLEPRIEEVGPIGGQKLSKESKAALQKLMSNYVEALYILKLPQELNTLFTKFDPKAQKYRELEEAALKKAQEEQKKARVPGRAVGRTKEHAYYPPYIPADEPEPAYGTPPTDAFVPSYEPPRTSYDFGPSSPVGFAKTPQAGGSPASTRSQDDKKESDVKKDSDQKIAQEEKVSVPPAMVKAMEKEKESVKEVEAALSKLAEIISSNERLTKMTQEIAKQSPYSQNLVKQDLPELQLAIRGTLRDIDKFKSNIKKSSRSRKGKLKTKIKDKAKKSFAQYDALIGQISAVEQAIDGLSLAQHYVYFGINDLSTAIPRVLNRLGQPTAVATAQNLLAGGADRTQVFQAILQLLPAQQQSDLINEIQVFDTAESNVSNPISLSDIKSLLLTVKQAVEKIDSDK